MTYLKNVSSLRLESELCTGCGRCIEVCPHAVFRRRNGNHRGKVEIADLDRCIECGACMMNCAFGALRVDTGVGCAAAVLNGMLTGGEPSCGCDDSGCCC